jgi:Prokaryotic membrane lipoprotein lipid attachment site.
MKKIIILFTALLLTACAAKKEKTNDQPVLHNGKCENAGKKIDCTWSDVSL